MMKIGDWWKSSSRMKRSVWSMSCLSILGETISVGFLNMVAFGLFSSWGSNAICTSCIWCRV